HEAPVGELPPPARDRTWVNDHGLLLRLPGRSSAPDGVLLLALLGEELLGFLRLGVRRAVWPAEPQDPRVAVACGEHWLERVGRRPELCEQQWRRILVLLVGAGAADLQRELAPLLLERALAVLNVLDPRVVIHDELAVWVRPPA